MRWWRWRVGRNELGAVAVACAALALVAAAACGGPMPARGRVVVASATPLAPARSSSDASAPHDAAPADAIAEASPADAGPAFPGRVDGCADGMVRVEGEYCTVVAHDCTKTQLYNTGTPWIVDVCLAYREPSRCVGARVKASFCMDRFEYPNAAGSRPRVLTSYIDAQAACRAQEKRLCTDDEFNFACEGPELLPYVYGFVRDASRCTIDRPFRAPDRSKLHAGYDACMARPTCAAELARVTQARPVGESLSCVSWAGVFDLNGNVGEWVHLPKKSAPHRGGLKGGWWGVVRARCRALVTFHGEDYTGYETGFRCCKDAASGERDAATDARLD